ncbi:hypothetical protein [Heliobacterium mobile]|nr:hypothetical protein [Heliobacterium mobile]
MARMKKITVELSPEQHQWLEAQSEITGDDIPGLIGRLIDDAIARDSLSRIRPELETVIKSTVRNVVEMSITQKTMVAVKLFDEAVSPAMKAFGNRVTESVFKLADRVERLEKQIGTMQKGQMRDGSETSNDEVPPPVLAPAASASKGPLKSNDTSASGEPARKEGVLVDLRDHLLGGKWPE